ncbi:MAG: GxxExxY protein [Clostridia bacterium]|nr:GxxExxY protein [Clostridia bacterium]
MSNIDSSKEINQISEKIIRAAIEVHKSMGPGLFESVYEKCLCYELELQKIDFKRQKFIPITYKDKQFDYGFRADLVVQEKVLVELKTVSSILPIHEAQVINYLNLSKLSLGLIINFSVPRLKDGIKRIVCGNL